MAIVDFFLTQDVRFPTSAQLDGSDAMNPDPDYSAAYVSFGVTGGESGHSSVFTIGRGNDVQVAALESLKPYVMGRDLDELLSDMGSLYKELTGDSQLRWLGPEKGVMHMAIGAVVNALWDIKAKREGKPVWELLADMSPEELTGLIDFRYLEGVLTPSQARGLFAAAVPDREARKAALRAEGYPAYTTSPGWLGYSDEKLERLAREAIADGFGRIKLKVGADKEDDIRRLGVARRVCGAGFPIAVDANQRWGVAEAIDWINALAPFEPDWVEEPTSPDDILGHAEIARAVAPIRVSTGEHMASRVIARQLLESNAVGLLQIDSARVAGVNENVAILAMAALKGIRVFPHAGGVGLCEAVQHLAFFDYVSITGLKEDRAIEYVDHLHEHFVDPVKVHSGRYWSTDVPGTSQEMKPDSRDYFEFPNGQEWRS
jgi:L-fuconate dehydratase